jgi:hypothetical protein
MKFGKSIITLLLIVLSCAAYAGDLKIESGTFIVITPAPGMNEELCKAGTKKAKQLGYNPICAFKDKGGHIFFGKNSQVSFKDDQYVFSNNDIVINAGNESIKFKEVVLNRGEYAISRKGSLEKQKEVLTGK